MGCATDFTHNLRCPRQDCIPSKGDPYAYWIGEHDHANGHAHDEPPLVALDDSQYVAARIAQVKQDFAKKQPAPVERRGHPRFYELIAQMQDVHDRKNSDYADTALTGDPLKNFRECERAGISATAGIITRLSDKWARVATLFRKRQASETRAVLDESLQDTLLDMANYSLLTIILLEEEDEAVHERC